MKREYDDTERYRTFLVAVSNIKSHEEDYVSFQQLKEVMAQDGWKFAQWIILKNKN